MLRKKHLELGLCYCINTSYNFSLLGLLGYAIVQLGLCYCTNISVYWVSL